jgi:hypothetical protein
MCTITHVPSFLQFASKRLGWSLVQLQLDKHDNIITNACLDAMEDGTLHVCAVTEFGNYLLWECRVMSVVQWERLCGLLQRSGNTQFGGLGLQEERCNFVQAARASGDRVPVGRPGCSAPVSGNVRQGSRDGSF